MSYEDKISQAVAILRAGGLVAIPTETVYGLAADARNPEALRKIFQAKHRPIDHPLIVHIANVYQLSEWATDIPDSAYLLAETFWPGPLTLILKKAPGVSDLVTGNQATIGIRIPNHPIALELLHRFEGGVAAPSANLFGRISPTTANAVQEELGSAVNLILEGGQSEIGVESTILDLSGDNPVILRPGMITAPQIAAILKKNVTELAKNSPRVSGSLESHYAPQTVAKLISPENLERFLNGLDSADLPLAVLTRHDLIIPNKAVHVVKMPVDAKKYAQQLYKILREIDKKQFSQIIIEAVPSGAEWEGIRDRLTKATR